jgi:regulatory protein
VLNCCQIQARKKLKKRWLKLSEISSAKNKAVDLLSRREHSRTELIHKLTQRGFVNSDILAALDQLVEQGLQSDERFAGAFLRTRQAQGYGPIRIRLELQEKGIEPLLIEQYIDEPDEVWLMHVNAVYHKKYRDKPATEFEEQMKRKKFLAYRGFTHEQISSVAMELEVQ